MKTPGWAQFEVEVNALFGLRATITSGNKFFDPGDGVTPGPGDGYFADAKYSERVSHSLKVLDLDSWRERAALAGKRFIMPLRFWPRGFLKPSDYVVLSLHDFVELTQGGGGD